MRKLSCASIAACALTVGFLGAAPAEAQKSADTLRIAINDPIDTLSPYDRPNEESAPFYNEIYRSILRRNDFTKTYGEEMVKSWKRIDPVTIEIELRDDLTFHSGNKVTADDAVYTINWASDPKVPLPNKGGYLWVKNAEKTGPYTFRVIAKQQSAADLTTLAYKFFLLDSKVHQGMAQSADYGRLSSSGTGPYRMVSLDRNKGVVLERWAGYKGTPKQGRAPIKTIIGIPIPEAQTQVAQLLTGGIDVMRNPPYDTVNELAKNPDLGVTSVPSGTYLYIHLDSIGRAGVKALSDVRVRKAIVMAVNRDEIAKNFIAGGKSAEIQDTVCMKFSTACPKTVSPYPYNPTEARKLLVEAGYADGLELPFSVHAPYKDAAEAVAGQLLKVGIKSSIQPMGISVYFKKRDDGELAMFMGVRPTGSYPEVLAVFDSFFIEKRDYWRDPVILAAWKAAEGEMDADKRAAIVKPALDRMNEEAYVLPIASVPTVFVHRKNVKVERNLTSASDSNVEDFFWK